MDNLLKALELYRDSEGNQSKQEKSADNVQEAEQN
jgi:hypothetical protein